MAENEMMKSLQQNVMKLMLPTVVKKLPEFEAFLHKLLSEIELEDGETRAGYLIVTYGETVYIITCVFDADDKVVRVINKAKAVEFIETLIKQL